MKYRNSTEHVLELRWTVDGKTGYEDGIAHIEPGNWFEPLSGFFGTEIIIRAIEPFGTKQTATAEPLATENE